MRHTNCLWGIILLSICIISPVALVADDDPNAYNCVVESEFANTPILTAPLAIWELAGCNVAIDSLLTINVIAIPDSMTYPNFTILSVYIPVFQRHTFFVGTTFSRGFPGFSFGLSGRFSAL